MINTSCDVAEIDIKNILEKLNRSATFSMSRGGRELFHTNFLAYILDIDEPSDSFGEFQDELKYVINIKQNILKQLFGDDNVPRNVHTFRERSNLDLVIIPHLAELDVCSKIVVLEAKLKSIPTSEQLEKYNFKFKNGIEIDLFDDVEYSSLNLKQEKKDFSISKLKFCLNEDDLNAELYLEDSEYKRKDKCKTVICELRRLLLAPQSVCNNIDQNLNWKILDWENFLSYLTKDQLSSINFLTNQLVEDYLISTTHILNLVKYINQQVKNLIIDDVEFSQLKSFAVNHKDFRRVRLHDLVGKVAYNYLLNYLFTAVENEIPKLQTDFKLNSYTFYTRSSPGFVIQLKLQEGEKSLCIGVQLQSDSYRHFIENNNYFDGGDLLKNAISLEKWMSSVNQSADGINKSKAKKFNFFDRNKFIYMSTQLINHNFSDLKRMLISSLSSAIEEIEKNNFPKMIQNSAEK